MSLSEAALALWAKSGTGQDWHPLLAHLLDVAACTEVILDREPSSTLAMYSEDLCLSEQEARAWVCALAGLHDLGKASPAFQQKWEEGKQRVWATHLAWSSKPSPPPTDVPHNVVTQEVLPKLLVGQGWQRPAAMLIGDAVGAHHGFRASRNERARARDTKELGGDAWAAVRQELFTAVMQVLGTTSPPPLHCLSGAAFERLAGLTSFADWIGSSLLRSPLHENLRTYYQGALARAREALDGIGWTTREPLMVSDRRQSLEEVFRYLNKPNRPFRARALQQVMEELLEGVDSPALFLLEAPMGEGKTEAALYAHLRLQVANLHRGLYVALPTQATGNAMFSRLTAFLTSRRAGSDRSAPALDLQLLHGASILNEKFQALKVRANVGRDEPEGQGSPDAPRESVRAAEWFTHRKRALLSEYGVGTIDQALLAILNSKHQFVRLWGLANRVVILDEVHAYDTYTGTLIESLVRWLFAVRSSVILMSATLPAEKRHALLQAYGAPQVDLADYPRITRVVGGTVESLGFTGRQQPTITVRGAPMDVPALTDLLRTLARNGGCVACIVNTVQRAQDLYTALQEDAQQLGLILFHARYPADQRRTLESMVLDTFGPGDQERPAARPYRAILIATQVVEQSLDLDFDVMVTDLAPIDLILQRAGRLHRHERDAAIRHDHIEPVLHVAGLTTDASVPTFGDSKYIYERYVLLRTWLVLRDGQQIALPGDIDTLVQRVYSEPEPDNIVPDVQRALREARAEMDRRNDSDGTSAVYASFGEPDKMDWLELPRSNTRFDDDAGDLQADDDRPIVQTRLGEPSVTIIPVYAHSGRLFLDEEQEREVRFSGTISTADAITWYGRTVRLNRCEVAHGIEEQVRSQGLSLAAWRNIPLLARCYPLVLRNGQAVIGKLSLRLDGVLGIVYERRAV